MLRGEGLFVGDSPLRALHAAQARPLGRGSCCTMCLPRVEDGRILMEEEKG